MSSVVVTEWGSGEACRLQQALRLTNEAFAERLGCSTRTIAKWHANPAMRLSMEMQYALDTMLSRATADEQGRFEQLRAPLPLPQRSHADWGRRLDAATHLASALDWLDGIQDVGEGTTAAQVEDLLTEPGERELKAAARARARVDRREVAQLVRDFYDRAPTGHGQVTLTQEGGETVTTILSNDTWSRASLDLRTDAGAFALAHPSEVRVEPDRGLTTAAVHRLAEVLVGRTRFIDAPVYRLLSAHPAGSGVGATFGLDSFARYALTWDLLEAEAVDIVRGTATELSLRERLLPDTESILAPQARICVGGAQALCAFARPSGSPGRPDYLLLVQARSPHVVNAAGRLAGIPKCFHQPINDSAGEVSVGASLLRELEEELFGREEVDLGFGHPLADPMHPSRLTDPMRWLLDSPRWDLQQTGFGFNLISGNYEFSALLAVHDEQFWSRYGGTIEGNWEAAGLRRYSSMDTDGLAALLQDPTWSDEGLVTVALGLTRLAELAPDRAALPPLQIGVTR